MHEGYEYYVDPDEDEVFFAPCVPETAKEAISKRRSRQTMIFKPRRLNESFDDKENVPANVKPVSRAGTPLKKNRESSSNVYKQEFSQDGAFEEANKTIGEQGLSDHNTTLGESEVSENEIQSAQSIRKSFRTVLPHEISKDITYGALNESYEEQDMSKHNTTPCEPIFSEGQEPAVEKLLDISLFNCFASENRRRTDIFNRDCGEVISIKPLTPLAVSPCLEANVASTCWKHEGSVEEGKEATEEVFDESNRTADFGEASIHPRPCNDEEENDEKYKSADGSGGTSMFSDPMTPLAVGRMNGSIGYDNSDGTDAIKEEKSAEGIFDEKNKTVDGLGVANLSMNPLAVSQMDGSVGNVTCRSWEYKGAQKEEINATWEGAMKEERNSTWEGAMKEEGAVDEMDAFDDIASLDGDDDLDDLAKYCSVDDSLVSWSSVDVHAQMESLMTNLNMLDEEDEDTLPPVFHSSSTPRKSPGPCLSYLRTPQSALKVDTDGGYLSALSEAALAVSATKPVQSGHHTVPLLTVTSATPEQPMTSPSPACVQSASKRVIRRHVRLVYTEDREPETTRSQVLGTPASPKEVKTPRSQKIVATPASLRMMETPASLKTRSLNAMRTPMSLKRVETPRSQKPVGTPMSQKTSAALMSQEKGKFGTPMSQKTDSTPLSHVKDAFGTPMSQKTASTPRSQGKDVFGTPMSKLAVVTPNREEGNQEEREVMAMDTPVGQDRKQEADVEGSSSSGSFKSCETPAQPTFIKPTNANIPKSGKKSEGAKAKCAGRATPRTEQKTARAGVDARAVASTSRIPTFGSAKPGPGLSKIPAAKSLLFSHMQSPINKYITQKSTPLVCNAKSRKRTDEEAPTHADAEGAASACRALPELPPAAYQKGVPVKHDKPLESRLPRLGPGQLRAIRPLSPRVVKHNARHLDVSVLVSAEANMSK